MYLCYNKEVSGSGVLCVIWFKNKEVKEMGQKQERRPMKLLKITDPAFKKYGRVIDNIDFSELTEALKKTPVPEGVTYEPSVAELEGLPVMETISRVAYGEMPVQIGYQCHLDKY